MLRARVSGWFHAIRRPHLSGLPLPRSPDSRSELVGGAQRSFRRVAAMPG
jgi:hypothetical protein